MIREQRRRNTNEDRYQTMASSQERRNTGEKHNQTMTTRQKKTSTNENRCQRCNRKLKDTSARLGWRCAEILGTTQDLNYAGDEAFHAYKRSVNDASGYLRKNNIDINRVNLPKFYESFAKQYLALGMDNRPLLLKSQNDIREALNPTYDGFGNIILKPSEAPDISTMLNLRDLSDYQMGKYSTTAMTENGFDPYTHLLQQGLNLIGATDKFGNKLKADGILGPKTQWAIDVGQTIGDLVGLNGHGTLTGIAENSDQFGSQTLNGDTSIQLYHSIKKMFPDLDIKPEDFERTTSLRNTSAYRGNKDLRNVDNIMARQKIEDSGGVTSSQLEKFNWGNTSQTEVNAINAALNKYGITSKSSIELFMATVAAESGYGKYVLEIGDDDYFADGSYNKNDRGVGYIQLTSRDSQLLFLKDMGDDYTGINTAEYIAENYDPWMVSAYVWSNKNFGDKVIMNEYGTDHGDSLAVFIVTQYFINGWPKGDYVDSDLKGMREGKYTYTIDLNENKLKVNGNEYELPNGWEKREAAYNNVVESFK